MLTLQKELESSMYKKTKIPVLKYIFQHQTVWCYSYQSVVLDEQQDLVK